MDFNNEYVTIKCNKFDLSMYEKYLPTIFSRVNTNTKDLIYNKLNSILKYYKEEEEYEIIK